MLYWKLIIQFGAAICTWILFTPLRFYLHRSFWIFHALLLSWTWLLMNHRFSFSWSPLVHFWPLFHVKSALLHIACAHVKWLKGTMKACHFTSLLEDPPTWFSIYSLCLQYNREDQQKNNRYRDTTIVCSTEHIIPLSICLSFSLYKNLMSSICERDVLHFSYSGYIFSRDFISSNS